jgi:aspartyl-tRNA(Asn)/glutamyl-tRNA(Gln) amidotransferase subunit B
MHASVGDEIIIHGRVLGTPSRRGEVLEAHASTGEAAAAIVSAHGFRQISDSGAVATAVDEALAANPAAVADYRAGKAQAIGFLVGQVMKATRGQANAALVQAAVRDRLEADRTEG